MSIPAQLSDTSEGLQWISAELAASLHEARTALERFVDTPEQRQPLSDVAAELHKIHGALRLVEVHGAALLTEEMVHVAIALHEETISDSREGLDALSRAMVQMPAYLDRVQSGGRDVPLILLPLLNDLRAVRGSPLLSENTLFLLNLDSTSGGVAQPEPSGEDVVSVARKLRHHYQAGLLGWLRGEQPDSNLATMGAVTENIQHAASGDALYQLFWIAGGLTEALREDGLDSSVSIKRLLGQVDRSMKLLIDSGEEAFEQDPPSQLINNLLYYSARANSTGPRITAVKSAFCLSEVLPGADQIEQARNSLAAPSVNLMQTVGGAIKQDLANVKDALDIFVRTGKKDPADIATQSETLKRIADTMAMLGLGDLRGSVLAERDRFAAWISGDLPADDEQMMASAAVFLGVEDTLDNELIELISPDPVIEQVDDATDDAESLRESDFKTVEKAVVRECLVNLSRVKESISQFVAASTQALDNVPALLRAINAGLLMLGKSRAVDVIDRIADYTRDSLRGTQAGEVSESDLDRLADAIVSVEYYLDAIHQNRADPWYMLDNADACMDELMPAAAVEERTTVPTGMDRSRIDIAAVAAAQPAPEPVAEPIIARETVAGPAILPVVDPKQVDPELLETFIEEAREEIAQICKDWPAWRSAANEETLQQIRRSYHTLKGSGRMVGAQLIGDFAWAMEQTCDRALNGTIPIDTGFTVLMQDAVDTLPALLEHLEVGIEPQQDVPAIIARAVALADGDQMPADVATDDDVAVPATVEKRRGMDPVLYDIFRNETDVHLLSIDAFLSDVAGHGTPYTLTDEAQRAWHTLSGSANMAGATSVAQLADPVNQYLRAVLDEGGQVNQEAVDVFAAVAGAIRNIVATINDDGPVPDNSVLVARILALQTSPPAEAEDDQTKPELQQPEQEPYDEITAIFGDEAAELLEAADLSLQGLTRDPSNRVSLNEMQRQLHTLKGGARMANVAAIGDLSHELESLLLSIDDGRLQSDSRVMNLMQESLDRMHSMADALRSRREVREADDLMERIQALASPLEMTPPTPEKATEEPTEETADLPTDLPTEETTEKTTEELTDFPVLFNAPPDPADSRTVVPLATVSSGPSEDTPSAPKELFAEESGERQEFARVSATLLDELLNNVGEVSIYHSRLEQQISTMGFNTAELAQTVVRLRGQLRKLEMETEAHILHRHHDSVEQRTDFDPLEMDRYSLIQQLSRALAESVSDLSSIQGLLEELTRDAETLLVQQSRVTTELQDGLMRTRMIPFQQHVPRFTRLVRQTAAETGKRAELVVEGGGELDRQVLERMLPPFDHMLRNAVVHGIEETAHRVQAGKPAAGTIRITLAREGSEMVIVIQDDGQGLNLDAIRQQAQARGLVTPEAILSDSEILQLVLEPGFSTASQLTQTAGRGVGMDIVANVVKQLGGSLQISSVQGQGATFTIRLPLTLAISQALLVRTGEELYAIPVPTLAGVARIPTGELKEYLENETAEFDYGGHIYKFQHLGALLGGHATDLEMAGSSIPLVLVRAGEHSTALIADEIVGSREVVVKPVGPQIAAVRGVAGATILGDGSIVVILDVNAMVRSAIPARVLQAPRPVSRDERPAILVVDDSITVRRVTQRLLERHDMRVTTAKDGVDAVSVMQEFMPDLILLDIEMPRMDGYEVATHVRNSPRLQGIPIVMVTSRVSDKHRNRALELGVNAYLGKPFQETQLLEAIKPLLARRRATVSQS